MVKREPVSLDLESREMEICVNLVEKKSQLESLVQREMALNRFLEKDHKS